MRNLSAWLFDFHHAQDSTRGFPSSKGITKWMPGIRSVLLLPLLDRLLDPAGSYNIPGNAVSGNAVRSALPSETAFYLVRGAELAFTAL